MLPVEISCTPLDTDHVQVELYLEPSLFWFRGHFPRQPVLPGVAQVDWVMHYGSKLLAPGWVFSSIENVKFQRPLVPEQTIKLDLQWQPERGCLQFKYLLLQKESEHIASSGKIMLCQ